MNVLLTYLHIYLLTYLLTPLQKFHENSSTTFLESSWCQSNTDRHKHKLGSGRGKRHRASWITISIA